MSTVELARLPAIDLSLFDIGDPWRDHVAAQIDWAAGSYGVFQILGHGIDVGLIDALLELGGKYLHRLPRSERAVAPGHAADASRDSLHCAPVVDLPEFLDTVREYTTTMTGLGHKLMAAMARGLRLDDGYFADHYTGNPATSLQIGGHLVTFAPPAAGAAAGSVVPGLLTIAKPGGPEGGRQLRFDGQWLEPLLPGALLCYVEPLLERLTHGHYVSVAHRLSLASDAAARPALAFNFAPARQAVLTPLAAMRPRPANAEEASYARAARC